MTVSVQPMLERTGRDFSAHRETELRTSKAERTVLVNLGHASKTKDHQPWASRAYKKLGLLGPAHMPRTRISWGNLGFYIFNKDSR